MEDLLNRPDMNFIVEEITRRELVITPVLGVGGLGTFHPASAFDFPGRQLAQGFDGMRAQVESYANRRRELDEYSNEWCGS